MHMKRNKVELFIWRTKLSFEATKGGSPLLFVRKPTKVSSAFIATYPPTRTVYSTTTSRSFKFSNNYRFCCSCFRSWKLSSSEKFVLLSHLTSISVSISLTQLIIVFAFRFGVFIKTALLLIIRKMNRCRVAFSLAVLALITKLWELSVTQAAKRAYRDA